MYSRLTLKWLFLYNKLAHLKLSSVDRQYIYSDIRDDLAFKIKISFMQNLGQIIKEKQEKVLKIRKLI